MWFWKRAIPTWIWVAVWTDALDGNGSLNAIGEVNVDQVGTYELRFERADAAGNLAEVLTRTVEVVNDDPVDFSLSGNEIEENLPSGTLIGNFAASDPNDPNGSGIYNFEILTESQKEFFVIDENHSLRTNQSLDLKMGSAGIYSAGNGRFLEGPLKSRFRSRCWMPLLPLFTPLCPSRLD